MPYFVISSGVENGASGLSDMDCIAAWEAESESGDERIKSLIISDKADGLVSGNSERYLCFGR
jgi:hypothetical protein